MSNPIPPTDKRQVTGLWNGMHLRARMQPAELEQGLTSEVAGTFPILRLEYSEDAGATWIQGEPAPGLPQEVRAHLRHAAERAYIAWERAPPG